MFLVKETDVFDKGCSGYREKLCLTFAILNVAEIHPSALTSRLGIGLTTFHISQNVGTFVHFDICGVCLLNAIGTTRLPLT